MNIQQQRQGAVTVLKLEGALTSNDAADFKSRMLKAQRESLGRLVLDASAMPLVDSKGLEALVEVTQVMEQSGKALKLCAVNETLREVLELTGLAGLFEHFEDVNAGVRSFL